MALEQPAGGHDLTWLLDVDLGSELDLRGRFVQGRPGSRFIYLSWQKSGSGMFRRAKLMFDGVPAEVLTQARKVGLQGRVVLTVADGSPICAAVRPPQITWSAAGSPPSPMTTCREPGRGDSRLWSRVPRAPRISAC